MSLVTQIQALATRMGTEAKALRTLINGNVADLSALTTTVKTDLVSAVNEVNAAAGALINDAVTGTATTWSSTKINTEITTAIDNLLNGAGAAYDTLMEIQTELQNNDTDIAAILTAQATNTAAIAQNATDIAQLDTDVGDVTTNFVTTFEAALA